MEALRVELDGERGTIVFARPGGVNVLSSAVLRELREAWRELEHDGARVIVLRSEGKVFLAGNDLREMAAMDGERARELAALGQSVFNTIEGSDAISIAALHGAVLGSGCELALACDIRIAAAGVRIGQPEVTLGLIPGLGGTQRLPRVVGQGWASRMILSGEALNDQQALMAGLVTDVVPLAELEMAAEKLAAKILARGPHAIRLAKKLVRSALGKLQAGLDAEAYAFGTTFEFGEAGKGIEAFLRKRPAQF